MLYAAAAARHRCEVTCGKVSNGQYALSLALSYDYVVGDA
jgi:hypothetical protein